MRIHRNPIEQEGYVSSSRVSSSRIEEVDRRLRALYGEVDWAAATGVVHVAALAASSRRTIIPGGAAPHSPTDAFVLGAARARADAIVTTGAILRAEPDLDHRFARDIETEGALLDWRRQRLARLEPALLIVLTASGDLPITHPALADASRGYFWTTASGARRLRASLSGRAMTLEIIADEEREGVRGASPPIASAVRAAMRRPGIDTVLVEAGPRAAAALYPDPDPRNARGSGASPRYDDLRCDELLLSRFHGPLADATRGPAFIPEAAIDACYARKPSDVRIEEDSGVWTFHRYRDR